MGQPVEGFALPQRGPFSFPADHGPHDDFRIEWWYLTATLTGPDGTEYGAQWTLFRSAQAPDEAEGWASPQLWMGHAAVTTPDASFRGRTAGARRDRAGGRHRRRPSPPGSTIGR